MRLKADQVNAIDLRLTRAMPANGDHLCAGCQSSNDSGGDRCGGCADAIAEWEEAREESLLSIPTIHRLK